MRSTVCAALAASVVMLSGPTASAATVTFGIEIAGEAGTFDAPDTGGLITAFSITIGGVTYDSLGVGSAAPVYDALSNDIRGNPGTEGFVLNSLAGPGCLALECVLSLEDSVDPGVVPPLYALFPLVGGFPGTVTASGEYVITPPTPIPLPAPLALLLSGLAMLWLGGRRRKVPLAA